MLINLAHALGVEPALLVAMTVTRLGRGDDMAPDTVPINQLIENATSGASPLNAGLQAKHCDRMAREIKQWAAEAGDKGGQCIQANCCFAQLIEHLPPMVFERCVARYGGNFELKSSSCKESSCAWPSHS
jgi:hypothetical protein